MFRATRYSCSKFTSKLSSLDAATNLAAASMKRHQTSTKYGVGAAPSSSCPINNTMRFHNRDVLPSFSAPSTIQRPTATKMNAAASTSATLSSYGMLVRQFRKNANLRDTMGKRLFLSSTNKLLYNRKDDQLAGFNHIQHRPEGDEEGKGGGEEEQKAGDEGYLPFPPPFHTVNIMGILFLANVLIYVLMNFVGNDDVKDFIVEHFTLSIHNAHRIYPFITQAFYQEHLLQLAIDCWLLWQFGNVMLGFLGGKRLAVFWGLSSVGGGLIHVGRQFVELNYLELDPLEVRGRCFGPNPFILGLVGVEGLIFRHLNFLQQPPVPFLVLTAFVMVIDVWRIFTTKPEEHGASTGGALMAYIFWALPTRMMGLNKLTAAM